MKKEKMYRFTVEVCESPEVIFTETGLVAANNYSEAVAKIEMEYNTDDIAGLNLRQIGDSAIVYLPVDTIDRIEEEWVW